MSVLHVDPAELHRECTLARRFADQDELLVGQEVGKMAYLVHDVLTAAKGPGAGVQLAPERGRHAGAPSTPALKICGRGRVRARAWALQK